MWTIRKKDFSLKFYNRFNSIVKFSYIFITFHVRRHEGCHDLKLFLHTSISDIQKMSLVRFAARHETFKHKDICVCGFLFSVFFMRLNHTKFVRNIICTQCVLLTSNDSTFLYLSNVYVLNFPFYSVLHLEYKRRNNRRDSIWGKGGKNSAAWNAFRKAKKNHFEWKWLRLRTTNGNKIKDISIWKL